MHKQNENFKKEITKNIFKVPDRNHGAEEHNNWVSWSELN